MDTGVKISASAHGVIIAAAIFGGPLFSGSPENTIKISQVSLISAEDFGFIGSAGETQPVLEKPAEVLLKEEVEEEIPVTESEEKVGIADIEETGVISEDPQAGEIKPKPVEETVPKQANTISSEITESSEAPLSSDKTEVQETKEVATNEPEQPEEQKEAASVKETTTKIVTEAEEKISDLAPAKASRPKGRPKNLELVKPEESKEEPQTASLSEDQIAKDITAAIAKATAEAVENSESETVGPPLSRSEMQGLVFSVQQCWNVPVGLKNDDANIVTMRIKLTKEGRLEEEPQRVAPLTGSAIGVLQAYEAARRALIRCQPYSLPPEKYATWREIEIVFNPSDMVLR